MFKSLKKLFGGEEKAEPIQAPLKGKLVAITEVPDPTFAQEMLGPGVAIIPSEGKLYAPVSGKISMIFDTLHALSITSDAGAELLFHIGLDTVKEKGEGFKAHVEVEQSVKPGDLLIEFDMDALSAKGYNLITPLLVCNKDKFTGVTKSEALYGQNVTTADVVMKLGL